MNELLEEHARCLKAFMQHPTPRLASALNRIEASIRYLKRRSK